MQEYSCSSIPEYSSFSDKTIRIIFFNLANKCQLLLGFAFILSYFVDILDNLLLYLFYQKIIEIIPDAILDNHDQLIQSTQNSIKLSGTASF
jgi:hypothetical protein